MSIRRHGWYKSLPQTQTPLERILERINDPTITDQNFAFYEYTVQRPPPAGFCAAIGESLLKTDYVERISNFKLSGLFPSDDVNDTAESDSFLQYLSQSRRLRYIELADFEGRMNRAGQVLDAIARNPRIEEFVYRCPHLVAQEFGSLLRATTTLKALEYSGDPRNVSPADRTILAEAIRDNSTLEKLTLSRRNVEDLNSIFDCLGSHACLRELHLHGSNVQQSRLTLFLQSTRSLHRIVLHGQSFVLDGITCLVQGLQGNATLETVLFDRCMFDADATTYFIKHYMQSSVTSSTSHCVSKLCFNLSLPRQRQRVFSKRSLQQVFVPSLFAQHKKTSSPTVGSTLQALSLQGSDRVVDFSQFFDHLRRHAAVTKLEELHVHRINRATRQAVVTCLPHLIHMRTLTAVLAYRDVEEDDFVAALRQNGSLHEISVTVSPTKNAWSYAGRHDEPIPLLQGKNATKVKAFLQRNKELPVMLSRSRLGDGAATTEGSATTDTKLVPALFATAIQTPRMSPNNVLKGLSSLGNDSGRHIDGKRRMENRD